jgi:hypothetical protein
MGACNFEEVARGDSAREAFRTAVKEAEYEYGHRGYTGTIAEKDSFTRIPLPEGVDPYDYAQLLIDNDDERISDKWGPAGCIDLGNDEYLFFGWASS